VIGILNFKIGKNWKEYEGDFLLRTDAVWEKQELEHFFRNYTKVSEEAAIKLLVNHGLIVIFFTI
jgi:hypothetical protein